MPPNTDQQARINAIPRTPISMLPVKSSQIAEIGHDPNTSTLAVRFTPRQGEARGGLYHYGNVSPDVFAAFSGADSIGTYFHKHIRPDTAQFPYVKIEDSVKDAAPSSSEQRAA